MRIEIRFFPFEFPPPSKTEYKGILVPFGKIWVYWCFSYMRVYISLSLKHNR